MKPPRYIVASAQQAAHIGSMVCALSYARFDPLKITVQGNKRMQAQVRLGVLKHQPKPKLP